jgi:hypothetical protein
MNGKSVDAVVPPSSRGVRSVQDEWGMFDPNQAGLQAAFRAVEALSTPDIKHDGAMQKPAMVAPEPIVPVRVPKPAIAFKTPEAPPAAPIVSPGSLTHAAASDLPAGDAPRQGALPSGAAMRPMTAKSTGDNVYGLTEHDSAPRRTMSVDRGAVYTLEFPTRCSQCSAEIDTVRVSRLLRTQVSFTSTLPRKGYIIVCPHCEGILSAELSGLI